MLKKNWVAISRLKNEKLRLLLLHATSRLAQKLSRAFPRCFLADGKKSKRPTREQIIKLIQEIENPKKARAVLQEIGLDFRRFDAVGECNSYGWGLPYRFSKTVFRRSDSKVGHEVDYENEKWVVVLNFFHSSDYDRGGRKDRYSFIIVRSSSLAV